MHRPGLKGLNNKRHVFLLHHFFTKMLIAVSDESMPLLSIHKAALGGLLASVKEIALLGKLIFLLSTEMMCSTDKFRRYQLSFQ